VIELFLHRVYVLAQWHITSGEICQLPPVCRRDDIAETEMDCPLYVWFIKP